ncbi:GntR family transcriptional regulator [Microbacterium aurum]
MPNQRAPRRASTAERLRDSIEALIHRDDLAPGDQMPTEQVLSERLGFSRSTVREALRLLEQDGLLRAEQGRGRFVSGAGALRVERPVTKYESITEMLEGLGYRVTSAVLDVGESTATAEEAEALQLQEGDPVVRLVRLRCGNDIPLVFSINVIPRDCLPGPIGHRDWSGSLSRALEAHGRTIVSSVARISAVDVPAEYGERFSLSQYDPWLLATETCITTDGSPVVYAQEYHRGSEIAFNVLRRS